MSTYRIVTRPPPNGTNNPLLVHSQEKGRNKWTKYSIKCCARTKQMLDLWSPLNDSIFKSICHANHQNRISQDWKGQSDGTGTRMMHLQGLLRGVEGNEDKCIPLLSDGT